MSPVGELLAAEVARQGPIPFDRFMQAALYCPEVGYYEQIRHTPGRAGDYFTSVSVGRVLGRLLAWQFQRWAAATAPGVPGNRVWQVVEAGAHDGRLARDLLEAWNPDGGPQLPRPDYIILEPSTRRRDWQRRTLGGWVAHVRWIAQWSELGDSGVNGVIFANELLDALPVRRFGWDQERRRWFEWGVAADDRGFHWVRLAGEPVAGAAVSAWLVQLAADWNAQWADGHTVEVSEEALGWWSGAACALRAGFLVALDYGLSAAEWGSPSRPQGTLRAYEQHRLTDAVLERAGQQDITAHVNWDLLRCAGEAAGLATSLHLPQGRWLSGIFARALASAPETASWSPAELRQFHTLTHPELMGSRFQVLAQTRGVG